MAKVFISYAREDYEAARRLYDFLLLQGQEPWLDKECLLPGQKWESAIQAAIRESHFFIALLSLNSIEKRGYVQKELRAGLEMLGQIPDSQIFLIPIRIGECEPTHERLRELQWVDMFPNWEDGLQRLNKVFAFVPRQVQMTLAGTRWSSVEPDSIPEHSVYFLREDGVVEYFAKNDEKQRFNDGAWRQSGNVIYMEFNHKYAQYKGIIKGNQISGEAQNINGKEWRWDAVQMK